MNRQQKFWVWVAAVVLFCGTIATVNVPVAAQSPMTETGLIQVSSEFSVEETSDRLDALLAERHLNVFARIDHAQNAASVGKDLRPTTLFIFGNPAVGTPLMQCRQSVAIDLPQKMLIWQDAADQVWLAYNDPQYLGERHDLAGCEMILDRIGQVLGDISQQATQA
ncbi:DUF302 domain-containing protein [Halomicronema sp. CCY15110]|uniref:DUF302 domain-containing protein n=1 Tax=Halomicronema sp. CCY15110 TaxID=2767773 RepID=UPI001EF1ED8C|nr:DUF302 domain-containing protein [Halomicronema sp. CCY15110]